MVNQIVNNFSFKIEENGCTDKTIQSTYLKSPLLKDKIHVCIFGQAHEIWLVIDKCVYASLHAHADVPSGTRSRPIIYASCEGSGETAH